MFIIGFFINIWKLCCFFINKKNLVIFNLEICLFIYLFIVIYYFNLILIVGLLKVNILMICDLYLIKDLRLFFEFFV